tara:strand:+ start:390 stop:863 length:474 start_codon:yes stop_codon:yes gene_type:complete
MSKWKTGQKEITSIETIISILKEVSKYDDHKIIVGSDSVKLGYSFIFTKAICVINESYYDRRYFYCRTKIKDDSYLDLSKRLLKETTDSIDLAIKIREKISKANIEIHADVNSNSIHKSSKYKNMIVGYISGCGFDCKIKPDSFVASGIADCHTRKA